MSNSAIYQLSAGASTDLLIRLYLEYEGHPEGAAYYFWLMHSIKNYNAGFAGRFLRANHYTEFCSGDNNNHEEATYRYIITRDGELTALHQADNEPWIIFYQGAWYEFVNYNLSFSSAKKLYLFKGLTEQTNTVMTLDEVDKYLNEQRRFIKHAYRLDLPERAKALEEEVSHLQNQRDAIIQEFNLFHHARKEDEWD
jgi:hypothetical protein